MYVVCGRVSVERVSQEVEAGEGSRQWNGNLQTNPMGEESTLPGLQELDLIEQQPSLYSWVSSLVLSWLGLNACSHCTQVRGVGSPSSSGDEDKWVLCSGPDGGVKGECRANA